jgi:hypothetical protein
LSGNDLAKANAAGCLGNLARDHEGYSQRISKAGGISLLLSLVNEGSDALKDSAAGALWNLSLEDENRQSIISSGSTVIEAASNALGSSERLKCLKELVCKVHHQQKFL